MPQDDVRFVQHCPSPNRKGLSRSCYCIFAAVVYDINSKRLEGAPPSCYSIPSSFAFRLTFEARERAQGRYYVNTA